ncbi:MAG: hypothetical protein CBE21_10755 [Proteobacteria bacterium TMED261]|nr:MAG: hypothetical protein CBE21_10755 [Proteobacteria bacterium TMED261]
MKTFTRALVGAFLFVGAIASADDHTPSPFMPVEIYGCSYTEGKGLEDLLAVGKKWSRWADKNIPQSGFAGVLTPYLYDSRNHDSDAYWMNITGTFETMGSTMDDWSAKGAKMQAQFDEVCTIDSHSLFFGQGIQQPKNQDTGSSGMMMLEICNMKDGATPAKMMAADEKMRAQQAKMGTEGGMMRWFPIAGMAREIEFDFLSIRFSPSMKAVGKNIDIFAKNMGQVGSPYADLQDCASGEMFVGTPVRVPSQN